MKTKWMSQNSQDQSTKQKNLKSAMQCNAEALESRCLLSTVADWRFDQGLVGNVPSSPVSDLNGANPLTVVGNPAFNSTVPYAVVPQLGQPDTGSLRLSGGSYLQSSSTSLNNFTSKTFTIEAVVMFNSIGQETFVGKDGEGAGADLYFQLDVDNGGGAASFFMNNIAGETASVRGTTVLKTGKWYFFAATCDGTTTNLYVNGQLEGSGPVGEIAPDGATPWTIGRGFFEGPADFNDDWIDEVRISDTALSPSQFLDAVPEGPIGGGPISLSSPIGGNIATQGQIDNWTVYRGAGQGISVFVNPSDSDTSQPASLAPFLGEAQIQIIDPGGTIIASSDNAAVGTGALLSLAGVQCDVAGTYQIKVTASAQQPDGTGAYAIVAYDASVHFSDLDIGQSETGVIASPFDVDHWTFAAAAGTQIQFNLISGSASGLSYSLSGPSDVAVFTELTASSSLIDLPTSGDYTLTVTGNGTATGNYGFEISKTGQSILDIGSTVKSSFAGSGDAELIAVPVESAEAISLALVDPAETDHTEFFAKFGTPPTLSSFDYGDSIAGSNHTLLIPHAAVGTWYVLVFGESVIAGDAYAVSASTAGVILSAASPLESGTAVDTTLTLTGAGFDSGTTVSLIGTSGTAYPETGAHLDSNTQLTVLLTAGSVPAGQYSVEVKQADGTTAQLPGFSLVEGGQSNLVANVIVPNPIGNHIASALYVQYSNTGDIPMPAPLLILTASRPNPAGSGTVFGAFMTLNPAIITRGYWSTTTPVGYGPSVEILASGASPGVLNPGESETIPVYYAGWLMSQWNFTDPTISFQLGVIKASDSIPVDWATLQSSLQPPNVTATAWNAIFPNLVSQLGTTSGGYVNLLDQEAAYLGQLGEDVTDVSRLWGTAVQKADASDSPVGSSLASSVDASLATPGPALVFDRSFGSNIDSRNISGPLGFGWSTPWSTSLGLGADGTVSVVSGGGGEQIFQPDSRSTGAYFSPIGDTNVLSSDGSGYFLSASNGDRTHFLSSGGLDYVVDTNGNKVTAGYNGVGQLVSLTASSGQSLTIAYNAANLISSVTDSDGRQTTYGYTGSLLTSVATPQGTMQYAYDTGTDPSTVNALLTITNPDSTHEYFTYNAAGQLTSTSQDGNAAIVTYAYSLGEITETDAVGDTSSQSFNENGQIARTADGNGNVTTYAYDPATLLLSQTTDPVGDTSKFTYNSQGNLLSSTDQLGNITNFTYAEDSRLGSLTDANSNKTSYAYDNSGNLLSTTYADGSTETSTFNPLGEPISFLNRNGKSIGYTYNAAGQLLTESFPDGTSYAYTYDGHGNLLTATDATGTTNFTYNAADELTEVAYPNGTSLTFTLDSAGRRTQMVDQTGFTVNYQYDSAGRLSGLTDGSGNAIVNYTYNSAGQLSQKTNGNGTYSTYSYDADGNVLHLINYAPGGTINSRFDYTYNSLGLETGETTVDGTWTYSYDGDGQLIHAVFASTNSAVSNQDMVYNYDALGNRTSTVINGVTTTYIVNDLNEYTSVGGTIYSYDADGNLLSDGTNTYTYNVLNQLTGIMTPTATTTYAINALGQRVASTTGGQTTENLIDPAGLGNLVGTFSGSGDTITDYTYGLGLTSQLNGGSVYYYDFDSLGSTAGISNVAGTYVSSYSYLPFGGALSQVTSISNLFQFVGAAGVTTASAGLYSMRARTYATQLGSFSNQDPIGLLGGELNLRSYAANDPINVLDPSGLNPDLSPSGGTNNLPSPHDPGNNVGVTISIGGTNNITINGGYGGHGGSISTSGIQSIVNTVTGGANHASGSNAGSGGNSTLSNSDIVTTTNPNGGFTMSILPKGGSTGGQTGGQPGTLSNPSPSPSPTSTPTANTNTKSVNSHDPNSLAGPAGYGAADFVGTSQVLPYRVDFENASTATAPAQRVTISDTLSSNLDWSTFQLTGIGWGDFNLTIPNGSQSYETTVPMTYNGVTFDVEVQAGIHADTGEVYATFQSIDPGTSLPPSVLIGFLPPEDGTGRGDAYISYLVSPKAGLTTGMTISNVATISFDQQTTIATDLNEATSAVDPTLMATVTIDAVAPTSQVAALAATTLHGINVSWSGQDDAGGSGIANYSIYVSEDGGPFEPWLTDTTTTSGSYPGVAGHTYGFFSIATDNAGNVEAFKSVAEATTAVIAPNRFVNFGGKVHGTYTDASGHVVTFSLSGPGTGILGFYGTGNSDPLSIIITGTTARASLTITTRHGVTTLSDLEITGALNAINASTVDLDGTISVTGTLASLTLKDVTGDSIVNVEGSAVPTTYRFGAINGLSLTSASAIRSLVAKSWAGASSDGLTAPSIGTVRVAGNFDPAITLTGAIGSANVIGSISGGSWTVGAGIKSITAGSIVSGWSATVVGDVGSLNVRGSDGGSVTTGTIRSMQVGSLTNATVDLTGGVGAKTSAITSLVVSGTVTNSQVRTVGNIGSVTLGGMIGSDIFAGVTNGITMLPVAADFADQSSILSFTVRGKSPFADSDIAAARIATVSLTDVTTSNGGTPFGVATEALTSFYLRQPKQKPLMWTNKKPISALNGLPGDLEVQDTQG